MPIGMGGMEFIAERGKRKAENGTGNPCLCAIMSHFADDPRRRLDVRQNVPPESGNFIVHHPNFTISHPLNPSQKIKPIQG